MPLSKIAPVMRQAQLAIEDHRFYEHGALDLRGTMRALVRNSSGSETQGGSSISQQYVKMVQVEACQGDKQCINEATRSSGAEGYQERKIRELRYAIALEKRFSKDQILERYLNIAYYGEGAYGVEAAARHYYSKSAKLTWIRARRRCWPGWCRTRTPTTRWTIPEPRPGPPRRGAQPDGRAEDDHRSPGGRPPRTRSSADKGVKPTRNGCVGTKYPFLCDYVYRTLLTMPSLGKTVKERENNGQAWWSDDPDR